MSILGLKGLKRKEGLMHFIVVKKSRKSTGFAIYSFFEELDRALAEV